MSRRPRNVVAVAAAVSALWLAGAVVLLAVLGGDGALWLAIAVAVALPVVAIWFAAFLAWQSASLGDEARRLAEISLREPTTAADPGHVPPHPPRPGPSDPGPPIRLGRTSPRAPRQEPFAGAGAITPRPRPQPSTSAPRQPALPLDLARDEERASLDDLIRALDFPDGPDDREGFRALRLALRDPGARRLVQASQDILTLLGGDGIYMDDLAPTRAHTALWRRFAAGERGPDFGPLGGIRDRSSLALTAARLRSDPVFRDAAHHFLRLFDGALADAATDATDTQLAALADTRSARAFMLAGRATGIFE